MPPCICGLKVDRQEEKLICIVCSQIFHPECCSVKISDLDLVKNSFKCRNCLLLRRMSLSLPPVVSIDISEVSSAVTSDNAVVIACANADSIAKIPVCDTAGVVVADIPVSSIADSPKTISNCSKQFVDAAVNVELDCVNNTLQILLDEVRSLKESNVLLHGELNLLKNDNISLRNDNAKLIANDNAMQNTLTTVLNTLTTVLNVVKKEQISIVSSPKRKKNKSLIHTASVCENGADITEVSKSILSAGSNLPEVVTAPTANADFLTNTLQPSVTYASIAATSPLVSGNGNADSDNKWNTVAKRKKGKVSVIGTCDNDELLVFGKFKWLHVSSFKNTVEPADIINYVSKCTNIDKKHFSCFKLVKKDAIVGNMKFVNFKLGVVSNYFNLVFKPEIWPANVKVRPFDFLEKQPAPIPAPQTN